MPLEGLGPKSRRGVELLIREAADGPREVREVERLARAEGISRDTMKLCRSLVCRRPRYQGEGGAALYKGKARPGYWTIELVSELPTRWLAQRGVYVD